jgi:predicted nucleotidyltransferase
MRLNDALDSLLGSKSKVRILRVLFRHPDREFTEREIAKAARLSPNTVNLAMADLRRTNVLAFKRLGRTHSYACNRESALYPLLSNVFEEEVSLRAGLMTLLRKRLAGVGTAIIYGSFADGTEAADSDLDLLVISDDKRQAGKALDELAEDLLARFSVVLSPVLMTRKECRGKRDAPHVRDALERGLRIVGGGSIVRED